MGDEEEDSAADIPVAPRPVEDLREQLARRDAAMRLPALAPAEQPAENAPQFPLLAIFLLMVFAALAFGLGRLVSYPIVAGVLGLVVLFWQVGLMLFEPREAGLHLSWWGALFIYLIIAAMAIFR